MANQITGRLLSIGQTVQIPTKSGATFKKREFLLDATTYNTYTGERSPYDNILPLELSEDKCAELDRFHVGDIVTVSFALQGRQWQTQDGEVKRMIGIRCYKLEQRNAQTQPSAPTAQQPMQQTASDAQQYAPKPAAAAAAPTMVNAFPPQVDAAWNAIEDQLPF